MQIQSSVSIGAAAGSVSQSTSKDRVSGSSAADAAGHPTPTAIEKVAKSEQSSADRDAQGAGPSLSFKKQHAKPNEEVDNATATSASDALPVKSPEPPSQLDLVG